MKTKKKPKRKARPRKPAKAIKPLKVPLEVKRDCGWHAPESSQIQLTASLPFFWSRSGTRVHRVRSAKMHFWAGEYKHTSFKMWCGQDGLTKNGRLTADPPDDLPYCATCEGRAIGAGQLGAREINGRAVIFTPREPKRVAVGKAV